MPIYVLGLNHSTAPVEIRERISYEGVALDQVLLQLYRYPGMDEVIVLSTCNRTEFYCQGEAPDGVLNWLKQQRIKGLDPETHLYQYSGEDAIQHVFRVASGLDSQVLGEPQILGQLKSAYQVARQQKTVHSILGRLFEQSFSVAKFVRSETCIGANPISIAYAAVRLAQQIYGQLAGCRVLLIGAGKTIELILQHLAKQGVGHSAIANRDVYKAQKLAAQYGGEGVGIADIPKQLLTADIIISSTASTLPLLGKGAVETALKARKRRPFFMVDIAVPRDIEPEVGKLDDVYLYTIDDLESVILENRRSRQEAAAEAEAMIQLKTAEFLEQQRARSATPIVQALRQHIEALSQDSLQKVPAAQRNEVTEEVLTLFARTLTNKILHQPSVQLRQAASVGDKTLLQAVEQLFKL